MRLNEKIFLLGVGAQKAGTTWLHRTLRASDTVNFGIAKEYHIWDVLYTDQFQELRPSGEPPPPHPDRDRIRDLMRREPGYYAEYFNRILASGVRLTGDITPAYSALSAEDFIKVRSQLAAIDAKIRVVFLMRDPFERCWSAIRMIKQVKRITEPDESLLLAKYTTKDFSMRTRYDRTIQNLREVFSETELYFGLYETLREESQLRRLSEFLGVNIDRSIVHTLHNSSPKIEKISSETRKVVQSFYSEVYDYCWNELPGARQHWFI